MSTFLPRRPAASIIIPLFNRVELTAGCWKSLRAAGLAGHEVVFIDNGSNDATTGFLESLAGTPGVTALRNEQNEGFAKACNQGARAARGDVLVFLNNDTVVRDNWLPPLLDELADHPETGVAGCKLLYPDGRVQHAGVCVNRWNIPYHIFLGVSPDDPRVSERRPFAMVTGACMAVRANEFLELGGFDEGYVNGHEDVDLCLRYGEAGKAVVYRPDSVVTHLESQSEGRMDHCRANTDRTIARWGTRLEQDDFNYAFPESARLESASPLSVAIKIPTVDKRADPPSSTLRAEALAADLCRRGHRVRIHAVGDWDRDEGNADVVLVIPGRTRYIPKPEALNVLWPDPAWPEPRPEAYQAVLSPADFDDLEAALLDMVRSRNEGSPSARRETPPEGMRP